MRFPDWKTKAITLSYDDGVCADKKLIEIISKYDIKCTFNISDFWIGAENHLTENDIKNYILANGHEVAIHGNCHIAPGIASARDGINDMLEGKKNLEQRFSKIIKGMAYPDSGINNLLYTNYDDIKKYLEMLGIVYGRTAGCDNNGFKLPNDWHCWIQSVITKT